MPLFINDVKVEKIPSSISKFLSQQSHFEESAKVLCNGDTRVVGPEGLLYVGQREFGGTTSSDDVIQVIGSEDATTCHLVIIKHTGSGGACVGHFDGCGTSQGLKDMIHLVQNLSHGTSQGRLEIHLAGGFKDDRKLSAALSLEILNCLRIIPEDIHLMTACITDLNTTMKNGVPFPIIYGIAINIKTGEIFKAKFTDKGPDQPLRSARHFTGGEQMLNIYDHVNRNLTIGPFSYDPHPRANQYAQLPNHVIRKHLSTSPEQEPAGFEDTVRAAFLHLRDYPDPMKSHFAHKGPRRYKKERNGDWTLIN
ncbi:protein N-terminal asparagine amidohydrolase [Patella vulgata]|uniref:protein N-terminal asparagine amidohydrolase n=1 Tax=Patella vulgata TaxID=6465 RepID=UPI0021808525|nr:protein N-terminal asparagine amidohydrolase [Patella vulgata]XP_050394355.1 protein N-terminal asparagine amidohydrolase [Patella vulgata]XP_050394356.1 protein N-terminal asparagine amidohydrolase [Patella vulgata]